jgi:hypothetical protein
MAIAYKFVHSSTETSRSWGTEYSELEGIAKRFWEKTMNWWRVTEKGPSKPSLRSLRMKSPRLQGVHRLTGGLLVQIDSLEYWQRVFQLEPQQNPILQR